MTLTLKDYLERLFKTAWQAAIASLSVAQVTSAITGGLSGTKQLAMVASGAAAAAVVSLLKNLLLQPSVSGPLGVLERFVSTFVQGAAATMPVNFLSDYWGDPGQNIKSLQAVGLAALGGGIAAVLSLMQNLAKPTAAADVKADQAQVAPDSARPAHPFDFVSANGHVLRAATIQQMVLLAPAVDAATWQHHIEHHDISTWLASSAGAGELAAAVKVIETANGPDCRDEIVKVLSASISVPRQANVADSGQPAPA